MLPTAISAVIPNGQGIRRTTLVRALSGLLLVLFASVGASAQVTSTQDINGDGMVDAVFTQKQRYNQVCFGDGTGAFTSCTDLIGAGQFTLSNQINTTSSVLVDWDKDGDLDIVLAMEGHENVVCFNDGGGQFNAGLGCVPFYSYSAFPYFSEKVVSGDLDGDGNPDLVFANGGNAGLPANQPNMVCFGYGSITADCKTFGSSAPSTGVALGDMDGDGKLDIIVSNRGTQNEVCLNRGRTANGLSVDCRAITPASGVSLTKNSNAVAAGNLPPFFFGTPDGYLDVAFANDGRNEACLGTGDWSGTNVGLTCYMPNIASSNIVASDEFSRHVDVAIADVYLSIPSNELVFAVADNANVYCFGLFTCSPGFYPKDANSNPIIEGSVGLAVQDINFVTESNGAKWPEVVFAGLTSRTYVKIFNPPAIANATLHPSSVTLSGGTSGPAVDTTPPAFFGVANVTAEATGPTGATATFNVTAIDVKDGSRPVTCNRASGSVFALGNTTVTCTATDLSNNTGTTSFVVTVQDTTGPVVTVPANFTVNAPAGQASAVVTYSTSAVDGVDGVITNVTCYDPANVLNVSSGSTLPGGATIVTCSAYDAAHNYGEKSFTITVETDVDNDGVKDSIDTDDDGDGIADTIDTLPLVVSNDYYVNAQTQGTITRNGRTVTIVPTAAGSAYALRATAGGGTGTAVIDARCGGVRKELRLDASGESVDWRCEPVNAQGTRSLTAKAVSGTPEFWKALFGGSWEKITLTGTSAATAGSPVVADPTNTDPIVVTIYDDALNEIGSFTLEPAESVDVNIVQDANGKNVLQLELLNGGADGVVNVTLFGHPIVLSGTGPTTFSLTPPLPTQNLTILGGYGSIGDVAKNVEYFNPATNQWQPAYLADYGPYGHPVTHPWGNVPGTNHWINYHTDGASDPGAGCGTGSTDCVYWYLYRVRFTVPADAVNPMMNFSLKADNFAQVAINGTLTGGATAVLNHTLLQNVIEGSADQLNADAVFAESVHPGENTITLRIADAGGLNGFNFRIDLSMESSEPIEVVNPDTTAPAISVPANMLLEATSSNGAVATFSATGTDNIDPSVAVTCAPASGSTFAITTTTVTCSAADASGNIGSASFTVTVADTIAPAVSAPASIVAEATSAGGAAVSYPSPTATDIVGVTSITSNPASGSLFPIGTTTVSVSAFDAANNVGTGMFTISVVDTTAPVLTTPADQLLEAVDAAGAVANFSASATDAVGATVSYSQNPGTVFPIGTTTVTVTATDAAGNSSSGDFTIRVRDTVAPVLTVPADQVLEATSAAGAAASFAASATDAVGVTALNYGVPSGSTFPIGTTTVNVSARDAAGNISKGTFTITVHDTTAPLLDVPANQVLEATSAAGAVANFAASATDTVGVTSLTYSAASGSTFAIGTTTVNVSASDAAGHTISGSFTITVRDTIAPALNVPANQVLEATSAAGAAASFTATATDAVGVTALTYSATSGSTFPIGTTTVNVSARDAAGHTTSGSFTITVRDTTAPSVGSVTPSTGLLWPPNHQMVAITLNIAASDAVGVTGYRVTATSSEPDRGLGDGDTANDIQIVGSGTPNPVVNLRAERSGNGIGRTYTITVVAIDAAGNASSARTTTVFVPKSQGKDDKDDKGKDNDDKGKDGKDGKEKKDGKDK